MKGAVFAVIVLATALAWAVARRDGAHRPVAALCAFVVASSVLREAAWVALVAPARAALERVGLDPLAVPLTGWARAAGHLDGALWLGWPVSLAVASAFVYRRNPWSTVGAAVVAWSAAVCVLVGNYHAMRGAAAKPVFVAVELISLVLGYASMAAWVRRREPVRLRHVVIGLFLALDLLVTAVSFSGRPLAIWGSALAVYVVTWSTVVVLHGGALWWFRSRLVRRRS